MATDYVSEWMTDELQALRDVARQFFEREAAPQMAKWSEQRYVDREFWVKAGRVGLLCPTVPEEYGGPGGNILHQVAITEEQSRVLEKGWGNNVHSGVVTDYILRYGSQEQCQRWLPSMVEGTVIGAIAMTEPGAGSDVRAMTGRWRSRSPASGRSTLMTSAPRPASRRVAYGPGTCSDRSTTLMSPSTPSVAIETLRFRIQVGQSMITTLVSTTR